MISAFGVTHVVSKAEEPPKESNRARRRRVAEEKAQGITRPGGAPTPKPETPKAEPKPEVKVETPKQEKAEAKQEAPKAEAPKPEAPKAGGSMGAGPQEAAVPKVKDTSMSHAYGVGQRMAFREGKGPIASAVNGMGVALKTHPGKTAAIAGAGAAGLAGATYLGGRAQQKKRDGR